jgi:hypothetical protein
MAIKYMHNNKPPGISNIPAKLYKKAGGLLLNKTHSLIKGIRREEKIPTDWAKNSIVPIYKNRGTNCNAKITEEYYYCAQDIRH